MKFIVFATDLLPIAGLPTSGTALRTHGMVEGLRANGHEVVVSVPQNAIDGAKRMPNFGEVMSKLPPSAIGTFRDYERLSFNSFNQANILSDVNPDVIFCGHWPAMILPRKPSQALIVDLAGPHLLERHFQQSPEQHGATLAKLGVMATADYFVVSGNSQRLYFLSFLLRAQLSEPERRLVTIHMPLNPKLPQRNFEGPNSNDYPRFVFGGVFLPWQDPTKGLLAVNSEIKARGSGSLTLIGGKHPNYDIKSGTYETLFEQLSANPHVSTCPMLPLDLFVEKLLQADVAVDLMKWNMERQLAMTIRSTTYLWAGVPVIYNDFADLGMLIRQFDAGWCISPNDNLAMEQVLAEIYSQPERVREKSKNASRLAREIFSWNIAVKPLLDLISSYQTTKSLQTDIVFDFPENSELAISSTASIGQYFTCRMSGLAKVEVRVATHDRKCLNPINLKLYEVDASATMGSSRNSTPQLEALVASATVEAELVHNNEWLSVETTPIKDSQGKSFLLEISSQESDRDHCVCPWAINSSPYPLLGLYYQNRKISHSGLCMRTICYSTE
ncbi:MAG: hypothetical protein IT291_02575 [Deltaproteobacteria bacterium]|nr:hypothetical protein [Deltaproteobacteria bacterium]